jgi:hypothetical protein
VPLVALAPDGGVLESEADGESPTLFTAAHEAASGFRWPRDDGEAGVRSTQRRHVARGLQILGVSGARPGPALAAAVTALPEGQLVEVATRLSSTEKIVEKGLELDRLVVDLAREARTGQARMDRLAVLGHLAGLWGPVYRWLPRPGRLLALGPAGTVPREAASREPSAVHDFGPRPPP